MLGSFPLRKSSLCFHFILFLGINKLQKTKNKTNTHFLKSFYYEMKLNALYFVQKDCDSIQMTL